ncbi:uncharacterized protein LOC103790127 isoform X2 [Callithrix jacchus]
MRLCEAAGRDLGQEKERGRRARVPVHAESWRLQLSQHRVLRAQMCGRFSSNTEYFLRWTSHPRGFNSSLVFLHSRDYHKWPLHRDPNEGLLEQRLWNPDVPAVLKRIWCILSSCRYPFLIQVNSRSHALTPQN